MPLFDPLPVQVDSEFPHQLYAKIVSCLNSSPFQCLRELPRVISAQCMKIFDQYVLIAQQKENSFVVYSIDSHQIYQGYLVPIQQQINFKQIQLSYLEQQSFQQNQIFQPSLFSPTRQKQALELFEFNEPVQMKHLNSNQLYLIGSILQQLSNCNGSYQNINFVFNSKSLYPQKNIIIQYCELEQAPNSILLLQFQKQFLPKLKIPNHALFLKTLVQDSEFSLLIRSVHEIALKNNMYTGDKMILAQQDAQIFTQKLTKKYEELKINTSFKRAQDQNYGFGIGYAVNIFRQIVTHSAESIDLWKAEEIETDCLGIMYDVCPEFIDGVYQLWVKCME
ncbi:Hypothetical_protein [Hexamita inflata]|uniref:Hypothetical_protein n=1 Tax=Hexamita inflata TaxID=28002 RepID=A0AA86PCL1_9EUKA|nr:Hypothetical protein HINF_LOCUS22628 [Hexamita inflata]